jgi:N,N'-diacetyllegionaminate synthase
MRLQARRSIVALRNIEIGEELNAENIGLRRPGAGLSPELIDQVMGLRVARQIKKGCYLRLTDISNQG